MSHLEILRRLRSPLSLSENAYLDKLSQTTINQAFVLHDGERHYLIKRFIACASFNIDRHERYEFQTQLAKMKLAPKPIYLSSEGDLYVEQWIDELSKHPDHISDNSHIVLLASNLSRVHSHVIKYAETDIVGQWKFYAEQLKADDASHDHQDSKSLLVESMIDKYQQVCEEQDSDSCLCHNDLSWGHIRTSSSMIFDWEYGGVGNRFFDLMSCVKVNNLTDSQAGVLFSEYAQESELSVSVVAKKAKQQEEFVCFTYDLWFELYKKVTA